MYRTDPIHTTTQNIGFLSQFVSDNTGQILRRDITGSSLECPPSLHFVCATEDVALHHTRRAPLTATLPPLASLLAGLTSKHQRQVARAIRRARAFGLMPYMYKLEQFKVETGTN